MIETELSCYFCPDVEETTDNLKATCDTFLATSDELIRLLTSSGPSSLTATAAKRSSGGPTSDGPQFSPDSRMRKPLVPSNLQTTATEAQSNGNISSEPDQDARQVLPSGLRAFFSYR
ncbi:unnamed protein product [Dibothriocephalus latus]|uniref:Uncharacterized protein n=1 Tax=Dibothriocephalus latus TaxID=60516 RepID=A0A3P7RRH0_DIBLA|nr:unnamed protein product [Dibothriocephalus latus]